MYSRFTTPFAFVLAACATMSLATLAPAAYAQDTFISTNTTLNAGNPVTGYIRVGYANQNDYLNSTNPTSPTVSLVSGGSGGSYLFAYNNSTVNVTGGNVSGYLEANNSSVVNFSGGNVGNFMLSYDSSRINFSGGSVNGSLVAYNNSIVNVSGGSVGNGLGASDNSIVNFSGGSIGSSLVAGENNGTVNFSGGNVGSYLAVDGSGTINLFGTGLIASLVNANYQGGSESQYSVSGTLSDGTLLINKPLFVQNGTGAKFTLNNTAVPEPGSVALFVGLTTVGASLLRRRRARK